MCFLPDVEEVRRIVVLLVFGLSPKVADEKVVAVETLSFAVDVLRTNIKVLAVRFAA